MELAAYESRSSVNDIQLIARVVAGDAAAERELYETYVDRIYRLAFRLAHLASFDWRLGDAQRIEKDEAAEKS